MKTSHVECKVQNENWRTLTLAICTLQLAVFLSGCVGYQAASEVQAGRYALLGGKTESALPHFQLAAELDPHYITDFTPLREGVWTYVGRAYYETGKLSEARKTLEQALSRHNDDYLARLYLGMSLARDGDRQQSLKEMQAGLRGIYDWLEYITYNTEYGHFWDPQREIRSEIQRTLAMTSGRDIDLQRLIVSAEWLGKKMEEEIDLARKDEIRDRSRAGDNPQP